MVRQSPGISDASGKLRQTLCKLTDSEDEEVPNAISQATQDDLGWSIMSMKSISRNEF